MVSIHDGLTYDRANSSALQATAARGAYGQVVINNAKSVINDTNIKMTCVVVLSINALMTCVVNDLCGRLLMWCIYILEISSALISICVSFTC